MSKSGHIHRGEVRNDHHIHTVHRSRALKFSTEEKRKRGKLFDCSIDLLWRRKRSPTSNTCSLGYSLMVISKDFPYPGARISRLRPTTTSGRMKPTAVRERARFFTKPARALFFAGDFNEAIERGRNKKVSQKKLILYPDHIFRSQLQLRMINLPEQPTLNAGILQALGRILPCSDIP